MSDHDPVEPLDPLDPGLAQLFAQEPMPAPAPGSASRVLGRVTASVAMGAIAPHARGALAEGLGARALGLATATFVLGGAIGASVVLALQPAPPARVVYVDRPVVSTVAAPPIAVPSALPPNEIPAPPPVKAPPAPSAVDTLGAERALLDDARSKLAGGDAASALRRLDEHARRFPRARLEEEREALAIQALANAGKHDEARARATTFRERWPSSVYVPAVDATLRSMP